MGGGGTDTVRALHTNDCLTPTEPTQHTAPEPKADAHTTRGCRTDTVRTLAAGGGGTDAMRAHATRGDATGTVRALHTNQHTNQTESTRQPTTPLPTTATREAGAQ